MTALPFRTFDECASEPPKPWAIKGVLALDEDSSWFGPPGSLKSMLLTDIAVHLARGCEWRGNKTKRPLGTVFCALERAALTRRRLAAYAVRDGLSKLPIAVVGDIIDMIDMSCVDKIVETVKAVEAQFGISVGLIVIDTYAKGIAAGGGDEDKAQHANAVAANLKLIHERLVQSVHIAMIGHSGKDEARGERGSSAKLGHVDLAVQISGDTTKTATVVKGNDQAEGPLVTFGAETITLGVDEDGEARAVNIVSTRAFAATAVSTKLTDNQRRAMSTLDRITVTQGGQPVSVEQWREGLESDGVLDKIAKNPRQPFKRLKDALASAGQIIERDGFVRRAGQPPSIHFPDIPSVIPPPSFLVPSPSHRHTP